MIKWTYSNIVFNQMNSVRCEYSSVTGRMGSFVILICYNISHGSSSHYDEAKTRPRQIQRVAGNLEIPRMSKKYRYIRNFRASLLKIRRIVRSQVKVVCGPTYKRTFRVANRFAHLTETSPEARVLAYVLNQNNNFLDTMH